MAPREWCLLKLGGELLEDAARLRGIASVIARAADAGPLAVVHGGGREIDAALARAGVQKRQVDGLRVTDEATLGIVIEVLAGAVNTRFVAAINAAGGRAVGLTGADASLALVERAAAHRSVSGETTDLGLVGVPVGTGRPALLESLATAGYVPVVASIGIGADGALYNVNADTLAAHLAARLGVRRFVIAGTTPGVLDGSGATIPSLDAAAMQALIGSGIASAGMIAKLRASADALAGGAAEVVLVDGREPATLERSVAAREVDGAAMTRMVA
jgi:acetylglutamate kinase